MFDQNLSRRSSKVKRIITALSITAILSSGFFIPQIAPAKAVIIFEPPTINVEGAVSDSISQNSIAGANVTVLARDPMDWYLWCDEDTGVCENSCAEPSYQEGDYCYTRGQETTADANGNYILEEFDSCDLSSPRDWFVDLEFSADNYNKKVVQNIDVSCDEDYTLNVQLDPKEPDPVILIPGILGSWKREVCETDPLTNLFGCKSEFVPDPILNTYDSLWKALMNAGYQKNVNLFAFGYNWRLDNNVTAELLKQKIAEVKQITGKSKVDLVTHSMGGLVARAYIQSANYGNDVDQLIFLGTPQLGSPESYEKYEAFEGFDSWTNLVGKTYFKTEALLSGYTNVINYMREKVPALGQLLPIYNYLKKYDNGNWVFRTYSTENYFQNTFLENLNAPDKINLLKQRVKITNIVSNYGENSTINSIKTVADPDTTDNKWIHGYPENFGNTATDQGLEYGSGDKTVPLNSATGLFGINPVLCEGNPAHDDMPTECQRHVIQALINKWPNEIFRASAIQKLLLIYVHSPVKFQVVDANGNITGTNFDNMDGLEGIQNSMFDSENGFVFIKNPDNAEYKINVIGIDNGGEYGLSVDSIDNNGGQQSLVEGTIATGEVQNYKVDFDSSSEEPVVIEEVKTEITIDDIIKDIQEIAKNKGFKQKNADKLLIAQLNLVKKWEKKLETIKKDKQKKVYQNLILIDLRVAENLLKVWLKTKKISQANYDILINDFNLLIQQYK
jgi:pimeloyl-ACP methyl ester carboxylesterase